MNAPSAEKERRALAHFGLVVFLFGEGMLFAGLLGGFIVLRSGVTQWAAPGVRDQVLAFWPLALSPLLLVLGGLVPRLAAASGAAFLALLAWGWTHLHGEGIGPGTAGLCSSTFFVLTGLVGLHVLVSLAAGRREAVLHRFGAVAGVAVFAVLYGTLFFAK